MAQRPGTGRPPSVRSFVWQSLIKGEEIDPVEFSKSHKLSKTTVSDALGYVKEYLITRKFPHPTNKSEQNRLLYRAGNVKALQARLDEYREKVYDMETVNAAMHFVGQPVDIQCPCLVVNQMPGSTAKDPDEVDYIPDWRE